MYIHVQKLRINFFVLLISSGHIDNGAPSDVNVWFNLVKKKKKKTKLALKKTTDDVKHLEICGILSYGPIVIFIL